MPLPSAGVASAIARGVQTTSGTEHSAAPSRPVNVVHSHSNVGFAYSFNGSTTVAALRATRLMIDYGLNSEESHSRQERAFYPHRRSQGNFSLTLQFMTGHEYRQAMTWFQTYAAKALDTTSQQPGIPMNVVMPSRNFARRGIPTTGLTFGDHIGSMVWSPVIAFLSVNDPADPTTAVLNTKQVSITNFDGIDSLSVQYFYPSSIINRPGGLAASLFGSSAISGSLQDIIDAVNGPGVAIVRPPGSPNTPKVQ